MWDREVLIRQRVPVSNLLLLAAALECGAGSLGEMERGEGAAPAEDSVHRCHLALTQEERET